LTAGLIAALAVTMLGVVMLGYALHRTRARHRDDIADITQRLDTHEKVIEAQGRRGDAHERCIEFHGAAIDAHTRSIGVLTDVVDGVDPADRDDPADYAHVYTDPAPTRPDRRTG
jgi:hypothetical protein